MYVCCINYINTFLIAKSRIFISNIILLIYYLITNNIFVSFALLLHIQINNTSIMLFIYLITIRKNMYTVFIRPDYTNISLAKC